MAQLLHLCWSRQRRSCGRVTIDPVEGAIWTTQWEECSCNSPISDGYSRELPLRLHAATEHVELPKDVEHGRSGDIIKVRIIKQGKVITSGAAKSSCSRIPSCLVAVEHSLNT